jgi:hypothetical protein
MLSRSPNHAVSMSVRTAAQRRLRRSAANRMFCSTNGCATFLVPDPSGITATCPICGNRRSIASATSHVARPH